MDFDWTGVVDYSKPVMVEPPKTQYELPGITVEDHLGVPVAVVPLWHAVVTAKLAFAPDDHRALAAAQQRLTVALAELERVYPLSPGGIFIQVAYGLPYFRDRIPGKLTDAYFPKSTLAGREGEWAVIDSIRFPKDPQDLVLENNEICMHFKSDFRGHIDNAIGALFRPGEQELNGLPAEHAYVGDLLTLTSLRHGFAGHGMPKVIGQRLGIPGAEHVPDGSMLFMGLPSSHVHGLAGGNLPSFETLPGYTDVDAAPVRVTSRDRGSTWPGWVIERLMKEVLHVPGGRGAASARATGRVAPSYGPLMGVCECVSRARSCR